MELLYFLLVLEHHILYSFQVPYGVHFKYSYFVREEMSSSSDIIWRPGPVYSLSIPSDGQKKQVIIVKDLWMKTSLPGLPTPTWGSWLMEADSLEGELFYGGNNQNIVKDHSVRDTRNQGLSVGNVALPHLLEYGNNEYQDINSSLAVLNT